MKCKNCGKEHDSSYGGGRFCCQSCIFGCTILVLNDKIENKTYEQELADDLISIVHYFTMKSYSHRRKLNKIRKELEESEKEERKSNHDEA